MPLAGMRFAVCAPCTESVPVLTVKKPSAEFGAFSTMRPAPPLVKPPAPLSAPVTVRVLPFVS